MNSTLNVFDAQVIELPPSRTIGATGTVIQEINIKNAEGSIILSLSVFYNQDVSKELREELNGTPGL